MLSINSPNYEQLIKEHQYLQEIEVTDHDAKQKLTIHIALGSGEYARIKAKEKPLVGKDKTVILSRKRPS